MKKYKIIFTLWIALQMSSCASTNPTVAPNTTLCVQQPCVFYAAQEQTFLEALASGFGSGLGWGVGKAIAKTW